jgi:hypothetical protein
VVFHKQFYQLSKRTALDKLPPENDAAALLCLKNCG